MIQRVWPSAQPVHVPVTRPVHPTPCLTCARFPKCFIATHGKGAWIQKCTFHKPLRGSHGS